MRSKYAPPPAETSGCFLLGELDSKHDLPNDLDLHKGPDEPQEFDSVLGVDADVTFTPVGVQSRRLVGELTMKCLKYGTTSATLEDVPDMSGNKTSLGILIRGNKQKNQILARPLSMMTKHVIKMWVYKTIAVLYYRHRKVIALYQQEELKTQLIKRELEKAGHAVPTADVIEKKIEDRKQNMQKNKGPWNADKVEQKAADQDEDTEEPASLPADVAEVKEEAPRKPERMSIISTDLRSLDEFPEEVREAVKKWKQNVDYDALHTRDQQTAIKRLKMELSQSNRQLVNKHMQNVFQEDLDKDQLVDLRLCLIFEARLKADEARRLKREEKMKKAKKEEKKRRKQQKAYEAEKAKSNKSSKKNAIGSSSSESDSDVEVKKPKALQQTPVKSAITDLVPERKPTPQTPRELERDVKTEVSPALVKAESPLEKPEIKREEGAKSVKEETTPKVEVKEETTPRPRIGPKSAMLTTRIGPKSAMMKTKMGPKTAVMKRKFGPKAAKLGPKSFRMRHGGLHEAEGPEEQRDWVAVDDCGMDKVSVFIWRDPVVEANVDKLPSQREYKASAFGRRSIPRKSHQVPEDDKPWLTARRFSTEVYGVPAAKPRRRVSQDDESSEEETAMEVDQAEPENKPATTPSKSPMGRGLSILEALEKEMDGNDSSDVENELNTSNERKKTEFVAEEEAPKPTEETSGMEGGAASPAMSPSKSSSRSRSKSSASSRSGSRSSAASSKSKSKSRSRSRSNSQSSRSGSEARSKSGSRSRSRSRSKSGSSSRSGSRSSSGSRSRASSKSSSAGSRSGSASRSRSRSGSPKSRSRSRSKSSSKSGGSRASSRSSSRSSSPASSGGGSKEVSPEKSDPGKQDLSSSVDGPREMAAFPSDVSYSSPPFTTEKNSSSDEAKRDTRTEAEEVERVSAAAQDGIKSTKTAVRKIDIGEVQFTGRKNTEDANDVTELQEDTPAKKAVASEKEDTGTGQVKADADPRPQTLVAHSVEHETESHKVSPVAEKPPLPPPLVAYPVDDDEEDTDASRAEAPVEFITVDSTAGSSQSSADSDSDSDGECCPERVDRAQR